MNRVESINSTIFATFRIIVIANGDKLMDLLSISMAIIGLIAYILQLIELPINNQDLQIAASLIIIRPVAA